MPDSITKFINTYRKKWISLDTSQRVRLIASLAIVLGSVLVALFLVMRPNYEKVITGTSQEIGEMSSVLTAANIGHKIADANTSILVRAKDKDAAQIALAQSGHLGESTKFEDSLNLITFSRTESDKQKIYKEYYESKIASKLSKMDSIRNAIVNLSIPEKSVFIGDNKDDEPTASVMITPTSSLTEAQLVGIAKLVASSVERLNYENVTIVDNTGAILNNIGETTSVSGLSSSNLQLQAKKKAEIETQIVQLLADLSDNVKVVANIVCDFDQEMVSSVTYEPPVEGSDSGLVVSQEIEKESLQNAGTATLTGTDANQGMGATITGTGEGSSYKRDKSVVNYEINQKTSERVKGLGNIDPDRSSITVNFLYGNKFETSPVATDDDADTVIKMVSNATGIKVDNITVSAFKIMPVTAEKKGVSFASIMIIFEAITPYLVALIILLVAFIFASKLIKSIGTGNNSFAFASSGIGSNVDLTVGREEEAPEIKQLDANSEVKRQIDAFIDKQPDIAAGMLRNWIYENEKQNNN